MMSQLTDRLNMICVLSQGKVTSVSSILAGMSVHRLYIFGRDGRRGNNAALRHVSERADVTTVPTSLAPFRRP